MLADISEILDRMDYYYLVLRINCSVGGCDLIDSDCYDWNILFMTMVMIDYDLVVIFISQLCTLLPLKGLERETFLKMMMN